MASASIGSLRVDLGLDSAKFTKGVKQAENQLTKMGKSIAKVGAVVSVASAVIIAGVKSNIAAADQAGKTAQKIGLGVEAYTELAHAADMSGVSVTEFEGSMSKLARTMIDTPDKLTGLGIAVEDAAGKMRSSEDVLNDLADKLASMPDGAEKTALAFDLMGRSGTSMIPMLAGGAKGLKEMREEAQSLGITISEDTFKAAEQFQDNLSRLGKAASGIGTQITAQLLPVLVKITDFIVEASMAFRDLSPETQKYIGIIAGVTAVAGPLAVALGAVMIALTPIAAAMVALVSPVGLVVAGVAALAAGAVYLYTQWDTLTAKFPGLQTAMDAAVGPLVKIGDLLWELGGEIVEQLVEGFNLVSSLMRGDFAGAFESGKAMISNFGDGLMLLGEIATTAIDALTGGMATGMIDLANKGITWAIQVVNSIKAGLVGLYQAGVDAILELGRGISDEFVRLKEKALGFGRDIALGVTSGLASAKNTVTNAAGNMAGWVKEKFTDDLAIQSPSRVFHGYGENIAQGLANGVTSGHGIVTEAIDGFSIGMGQIQYAAESAFEGLITGSMSAKDAISGLLSSLAKVLINKAFTSLFDGFSIPGFATGTPSAPGGLAMVGERGPELVNLPRGASVYPAGQTSRMMGGGGNMTFAPVIDARGADVGAVARLEAAMAKAQAEFEGRVVQTVNMASKRRQLV
jgi:hypothetical protein